MKAIVQDRYGDVDVLELGLQAGELAAQLVDLDAQAVGANGSEVVATTIQPRAKLHPFLEVAPVLLAELLASTVWLPRAAALGTVN